MVYVKQPGDDDDGVIWGDQAPRSTVQGQQEQQEQQERWAQGRGDASSASEPVAVKDVITSDEWKKANMSTFDGQLSRVGQIKRSGHPPMKVITASQLESIKRLPRSSEDLTEDLESLLQRHGREKRKEDACCGHKIVEGNKPSVVVVMFSHKWLRPDAAEAHPDDASGHKARAMVQFAKWLKWLQAASKITRHDDICGNFTGVAPSSLPICKQASCTLPRIAKTVTD